MHLDIVDLRAFYDSPLGQVAERSIGTALQSIWSPLSGERLVGLGHTAPWLDRFAPDAERVISLQVARHGAMKWPAGKSCSTALVFDEELPLPDASIDRILLVHTLEHCEAARETLTELWRVLAPGGRLVIVVPNRRGVWARLDHTPFGAGRPYSAGQLSRLLVANSFTPTASATALGFPPMPGRWWHRSAGGVERLTRKTMPMVAGAIVMEATKRIHQGVPARQRKSRRVFVPVLAPQGAAKDRGEG
jgi:SAM-dependent methyltransferase